MIYTTDSGPMVCLWPDAGMSGEHVEDYEGRMRIALAKQ